MSHSNVLFSVISNAGPRSLHDASFTRKRAPAAPSYHHKHVYLHDHVLQATLRSLSACRLRSCLYLLVASAFAFVCLVLFALAINLRNCSFLHLQFSWPRLDPLPFGDWPCFYRHPSLPGDCLDHGD